MSKKECAEKIAEVIAETLGCMMSSVSVAIKDIPEEQWKEKVWDECIIPDEKFLYKKPGYSYKNIM
jgi:4-oxalocrotonate tautomerase